MKKRKRRRRWPKSLKPNASVIMKCGCAWGTLLCPH